MQTRNPEQFELDREAYLFGLKGRLDESANGIIIVEDSQYIDEGDLDYMLKLLGLVIIKSVKAQVLR